MKRKEIKIRLYASEIKLTLFDALRVHTDIIMAKNMLLNYERTNIKENQQLQVT